MKKTVFRPFVEILEDRCLLATVTNLADAGSGSLRQAIADTPSGGIVQFASDLSGTLTLTSATLVVAKDLTISGPGPSILTINGDGLFQVFRIDVGYNVAISGLTIANGRSLTPGAGIFNDGNLTLTDCVVSGHRAQTPDGVAIYNNHNTLTITNCWISNNIGFSGNGAGIYNNDGTLNVNQTTVSDNKFTNGGQGAGIFVQAGTVNITNVTVANNGLTTNDGFGGGLFQNGGGLTLTHVTVAGNRAREGGGIRKTGGSLTLRNTIVARNASDFGGDLYGTVNSATNSLIGNPQGMDGVQNGVNGNKVGALQSSIDPLLGSLQNNGGPSPTMALLAGSQAINSGNNSDSPPVDQRGFNRIINAIGDMGAFEYQPPATLITFQPLNPSAAVGQSVSFQATVAGQAQGSNIPEGTVTFSDGGRVLATVSLSGGIAVFTTSTLTPGSHRISSRYNGFVLGDYQLATSFAPAIVQFIGGGLFALGGSPGRVQLRKVADGSLLTEFSPYGAGYAGGITVALGDINGDGYQELVTGALAGNQPIKVFSGKAFFGSFNSNLPDASLLMRFKAYGDNFNVGVNVAVGDISGNGFADIVTGAAAGNPHVKIYSGQAIANGSFQTDNPDANLLASFFPYALEFNVGANVAVGDVNGDGFAEASTGATVGNPHVKIYDGIAIANGTFGDNPEANVLTQFFGFALQFNVGANVAWGDSNGDGFADLIIGASQGNPHVKTFNGSAIANKTFNSSKPDDFLLGQFFAYDLQFNVGAYVGAADVTGDGKAEILTGASRNSPHFRVVPGNAQGTKPPALFEGIPSTLQGGIAVGA